MTTDDGRSCFLKTASDANAAALARERGVLKGVAGPMLPELVAAGLDFLLLEDLSSAAWPPPWPLGAVDAVMEALEKVHALAPPPGLPTLAPGEYHTGGWTEVATDPGAFLALGCCTPQWWASHADLLVDLERRASLDGSELVHLDVRSDNLCIVPGRGAVLVDWSWACVGNGALDVAAWVPSLHLEGGAPLRRFLGTPPELVAVASGYWARRATLPAPSPSSTVRALQAVQTSVVLKWLALLLGLPPPRLSGTAQSSS